MQREEEPMNVYGKHLKPCSHEPLTGFFRSGFCETCEEDLGSHTVCAVMTETFLAYTKSQGNDLTTPHPHFPGLNPGDRWCLCASRWKEAWENYAAPQVDLEATHEKALEEVPLRILKKYAIR